jgi:hypothetical protein
VHPYLSGCLCPIRSPHAHEKWECGDLIGHRHHDKWKCILKHLNLEVLKVWSFCTTCIRRVKIGRLYFSTHSIIFRPDKQHTYTVDLSCFGKGSIWNVHDTFNTSKFKCFNIHFHLSWCLCPIRSPHSHFSRCLCPIRSPHPHFSRCLCPVKIHGRSVINSSYDRLCGW